MTKKATYDFCTYEFERSHGKLPRGYGGWAFAFKRNAPIDEVVFAPSSTYQEAKRWITDQARRCDLPDGWSIIVCS
jgi:hypothetical protein